MEKEKDYLRLVEELLKNYKKAKFNKAVFGFYHLEKLITIKNMEQEEEEAIITTLERSIENIKKYPEKGEIYYDIIQSLFIKEQKTTLRELTKKYSISLSSVFSYKTTAVAIIADLFKDFYVKEELSC